MWRQEHPCLSALRRTHTHTHTERETEKFVRSGRGLERVTQAEESAAGTSLGGVTCAELEPRQQQKFVINVRTSSCLLVTSLLPEAPNGFTRIFHPVEMKRNFYGTKQNC